MKARFAWTILIAAACSLSAAQQAPDTSPHVPEMDKLVHALAGGWSITENDEPSPQIPNGETYQGKEVWSEQPGGGPVMEQFHAQPASGDEYETAVFWWDGKAHKLRGLWCARINDEGCNGFTAKWVGNKFVNDGVWEYGGKKRTWREVFEFPTPDSFVQKLYIGDPGAKQKLVSTIHGARMASKKKS